ncbi:hypothetical protein IG631_16873 [Alternaria alternata]|nr:hypothetical protein IG631_16873 [Alternaria alternata]
MITYFKSHFLLSDSFLGYAALALVLAAVSFLIYRWALPKPIPGIPYDKKVARNIFGNLPELISWQKVHGRPILYMTDYCRSLGSPLAQVWLGPLRKPALVLTDFTEIENLTQRRAKEFGRDRDFTQSFRYVVPEFHVALEKEDPRYSANKDLLKDTMTPAFLQNIYMRSTNLVSLWKFKHEHAHGRAFDAFEDIFNAASDMILAAAIAVNDENSAIVQQLKYLESFDGELPLQFDEKFNSVVFSHLPDLAHIKGLERLSHHIGEQVLSAFPNTMHYYCLLKDKVLRQSYAWVKRFEAMEIQKSISRLENKSITFVLDHMVQRERKAAESKGIEPDYFRSGIFDELTGYYQAGHETSATTITWTLKFLAQNQDAQDKLRSDLRQYHAEAYQAGRQPTKEEIAGADIPYLHAIIEETLRMRPPFPALIRSTLVDTEIMGYRIPKGTTILMPSSGPGLDEPAIPVPGDLRTKSNITKRRPDWSPEDVHLYNPDRWLKLDEEFGRLKFDPSAGPMQSFGFGPRQCFGKRLAYIQLRTLVTLLFWNFKFVELDGEIASLQGHESTTLIPNYCHVKLEEVTA